MRTYKTSLLYRAMLIAGVVALGGCNFSNEVAEYQAPEPPPEPDYSSPLPDQEPLSTFDDDDELSPAADSTQGVARTTPRAPLRGDKP